MGDACRWAALLAVGVLLGGTGAVARGNPPGTGASLLARGDSPRPTVVLDPGHNGGNGRHPGAINRLVDIGTGRKACDTAGAQTASGYPEHRFTLDVVRRVARRLRRAGFHVVLTRRTDRGVGPCIDARAAIGNRARAIAAVSVHADGGPVGGRGFHVIVPARLRGLTDDIVPGSRRLGHDVRAAYRSATGLPYASYVGVRGISTRGDLGGLNLSDVPKVFIETANMRNATDAALLVRPSFRRRVAAGIARGIQRFAAAG